MTDLNRYLPPMPPPPFARMERLVMEALPAIRPVRRISVPEWAAENRRVETLTYRAPWDNAFAPYMVEPSAMTTSRRFGAVVFVGPARTVKTEALVLNTIGHRIDCMPRNMLVVGMTKDSAREFSLEKLDPFLRTHPKLSARIVKSAHADATFAKRFLGNMRLRIGFPVVSQLSMSDIPDVLLTDYDRMSQNVGGEGSPFDLARKRAQQFGTLGKTIVESSPGKPITNPDWQPESPHEAPPCTGILSLFNRGTRARWYWNCPHCQEQFQPLFETLHCAENGSPGERAKTVEMICPNCGAAIGPEKKQELNRAGIWLHETESGDLVAADSDQIRETDIASYWMEGPAAALQSWPELMLRYLQAFEDFERTQDEQSLKTTVNVDQGRPYLPQVAEIGEHLTKDALKALSQPFEMKVAPAQTRFITLQVDIQGNRFVVDAQAWGVDGERWLIDRFDIASPPEGAPGWQDRIIDPASYFEDWQTLMELLGKPYPVADTGRGLLPRCIVIDSGGARGVTDKAYRFYRAARRAGVGHRVFISKGRGGDKLDRAVLREPERRREETAGKRKAATSDVKLLFLATDKLKDETAVALMRKKDGPGKYHLPEGLAEKYLDEFCAEHRTDSGWQVNYHGIRNESLDLAVMAKGAAIAIGAEGMNWDAPKPWAAPVETNSYAVAMAASVQETTAATARKGRRIRSKGIG